MKFTLALTAAILVSGTAYANEEGGGPFAVIVNHGNQTEEVGPGTLRGIFGGTITDWSGVEESGMTGPILALRLVDSHPVTQAFVNRIQLTRFGNSINVIRGSAAPMIIAIVVAMNSRAIGVDDPAAIISGDRRLEIDD